MSKHSLKLGKNDGPNFEDLQLEKNKLSIKHLLVGVVFSSTSQMLKFSMVVLKAFYLKVRTFCSESVMLSLFFDAYSWNSNNFDRVQGFDHVQDWNIIFSIIIWIVNITFRYKLQFMDPFLKVYSKDLNSGFTWKLSRGPILGLSVITITYPMHEQILLCSRFPCNSLKHT